MSLLCSCTYSVNGDNLLEAGEASTQMKGRLNALSIPKEVVRRACICMYEGEINMVIHANGGTARFSVTEDTIEICLEDTGPGISDLDYAMREGTSTADAAAHTLGFGAGMGLPNMKKSSDRMEIRTQPGQGTTVTMWIHYQRENGL
jgi:anti-sigma regulatory factor (Ser/Thr protein kinase)